MGRRGGNNNNSGDDISTWTDFHKPTPPVTARVAVEVARLIEKEEEVPPARDQAGELFHQLQTRFGDNCAANTLFFAPDPNGRGNGYTMVQGFADDDRKCALHVFFSHETKRFELSAGGMVSSGYTKLHKDVLHPIPDAKTFRVYLMMMKGIMWEKDLAIPTTDSDESKN